MNSETYNSEWISDSESTPKLHPGHKEVIKRHLPTCDSSNYIECFIPFMNSKTGEIFIQPSAEIENLKEIQTELQMCSDSPVDEIKAGITYAARDPKEQTLCRAFACDIESENSEEVKMYFMDFGNKDMISVQAVYKLPTGLNCHFFLPLAIPVFLDGINPKEVAQSRDFIQLLESQHGKPLFLSPVQVSTNASYYVELFAKDGEQNIDVRKLLTGKPSTTQLFKENTSPSPIVQRRPERNEKTEPSGATFVRAIQGMKNSNRRSLPNTPSDQNVHQERSTSSISDSKIVCEDFARTNDYDDNIFERGSSFRTMEFRSQTRNKSQPGGHNSFDNEPIPHSDDVDSNDMTNQSTMTWVESDPTIPSFENSEKPTPLFKPGQNTTDEDEDEQCSPPLPPPPSYDLTATFPPSDVTVGQEMDVEIAQVNSPDDFWCVVMNGSLCCEQQQNMNRMKNLVKMDNPQIGMHCLMQDGEMRQRVEITKINNNDTVDVICVDFRKHFSDVPVADLIAVTSKRVLQVPIQSFHARLDVPEETLWKGEIEKALENIVTCPFSPVIGLKAKVNALDINNIETRVVILKTIVKDSMNEYLLLRYAHQ